MNNKSFYLASLLTMSASSVCAYQAQSIGGVALFLQVRHFDPTPGLPPVHKSPVLPPVVALDDHTLTFDSSCHNCTLRIVNAENEVEYTATITSDTLVLPSTLEGQYELQIIRDNWCFYGDIEL